VLYSYEDSSFPSALIRDDGRFLAANERFATLVGADSVDQIKGSDLSTWLVPITNEIIHDSAIVDSLKSSSKKVLLHRTQLEVNYKLHSLNPAKEFELVLLEIETDFTLDRIYARAFQLNPGLSAISVLDTGIHLDVNDAWLNSLGYERQEVIGKTAAEMNLWEHGNKTREEIVRQLLDNGQIRNHISRLRAKTGALRDIIVSAELVEHDGKKLAFFASHDITEIRLAQDELAALNRELEERVKARTADIEEKNHQLTSAIQSAKLANEAKSNFLSMMSHEIRTPLNAIINMVDLLLERQRSETDRCYLKTMDTASKALLSIVDDILDTSRIESGRLNINSSNADVEQIVQEALQSIAPLAHRKGIDVAATISPSIPEFTFLDPIRLRQIILNLGGNAVNYTQSGWINLSVDIEEIGTVKSLCFEFEDTGIGIDPANYDRIFEPFNRIESNRENEWVGTGLGLSIAKGLAKAMGGSISVISTLGQGSSFRLSLPIIRPSTPRERPNLPIIALVGPHTQTMRAFVKTLNGFDAQVHMFDSLTEIPSVNSIVLQVAIVVLPVSIEPEKVEAWCQLARSLCKRVNIFIPTGIELDGFKKEGLDNEEVVNTYPVVGSRLAEMICEVKKTHVTQDANLNLTGTKILVVDDAEVNREVVKYCLSAVGAEIWEAASGYHALQLLKDHCFDIVLLDLRMPGLDGYAIAKHIRSHGHERLPAPSIIAFSANITQATIQKMKSAGMDGFIAKPFRPSEIRRIIRDVRKSQPNRFLGEPVKRPNESLPVVDSDFLTEIIDFIGVRALHLAAEKFERNSSAYLKIIRSTNDEEICADTLHKLGGAASSLGLLQLSNLCEIEEMRLHRGTSKNNLDFDKIRFLIQLSIDELQLRIKLT